METMSFDIITYIRKAFENDNCKNCSITINGSTEKGDGYGSYIHFASISLTTREGVEERFEVAVKSNKMNSVGGPNKLFEREIYVYGTILPKFNRFQIQNNIENIFSSFPKHHKTVSDGNKFVIILENLKESGYRLYDHKKPLDLDHVKLVLREYGKFHAISFAFKNKSKDDFDKLVANYEDLFVAIVVDSLSTTLQRRMEITCDILRKNNKLELIETCQKILEKNAGLAMIELLKTVEPESAILHGDCWSNNFMYKYESENATCPTKVAILDWQISRLHSPVLDISYFIYSTCSEEQFNHFDDLLDIYYSSFSTFLAELGCDPEIIFPYSTLKRHWKKYSLYGFLIATSFLHIMLCDNEEAPNEYKDGKEFVEKFMNVNVQNESGFERRIIDIVTHFSKYAS